MSNYVELIPEEIVFPRARFSSDGEYDTYNEKVKSFNSEKARDSLKVSREGSQLFQVSLLNQLGIKTANLSEIYHIWDINPNFLSGHYEDVPKVVLRTNGDSYSPNDLVARTLYDAAKKRSFIKGNLKHSHVLRGLKVEENKDSEYGLVLVPGEDFSCEEAPVFDYENNQRKFLKVEKEMPVLLSNKDISELSEEDKQKLKTLYTKKEGVSRLDVGRYSYLDSGNGDLSDSSSDGRVVVIDAAGVSQKKLEDYLLRIKQERKNQEASLEERFKTAMNILSGKN